MLAVLAGAVPAWVLSIPLPWHFLAIPAGAGIHLGIVALAYPGIPLPYPSSDSKVTFGIPCPSKFFSLPPAEFLSPWLLDT